MAARWGTRENTSLADRASQMCSTATDTALPGVSQAAPGSIEGARAVSSACACTDTEERDA